MNPQTSDTIGQFLWFLMFATPLIAVLLAWRFFKVQKILRVIIGLLIGGFISFFLYYISLGIIFHNGFGDLIMTASPYRTITCENCAI